jgi:hypothetical protein
MYFIGDSPATTITATAIAPPGPVSPILPSNSTPSGQAAGHVGIQTSGIIGTTLRSSGNCEAVDLRAGSRVLVVAAGNGNCSLAAARRWCDVVSTDYVPSLLEDGKRRAAGERLSIAFQEADAEALPFADGEFDVVLSSFGVMFAPNHSRSALGCCGSAGPAGVGSPTGRPAASSVSC